MMMEVDHFNPKISGKRRNWHGNLVPSARLCNNTKSDHWPSKEEIEKGIRYLNPYDEMDYGVHIFEDRSTGKLQGVTPAGKWHILRVGLNADHLVKARLRRTLIVRKFLEGAMLSGADSKNEMIGKVMEHFSEVSEAVLNSAIPEIPQLPV